MKKIFDFYEENSKIFPNYIILSESRYIYKNIQKKQKLIDQLQEMEIIEKEKSNKINYKEYKNKVINTEECNSIMNQTQSALCQTKNNSFNSVDLLIDHIERADFYKDNKNFQSISKKVDVIVKNKVDEKSKTRNSVIDPASSQYIKKDQLMNSIIEKKLSHQDTKFKDKFFMKKLILNPNKVVSAIKNGTNIKNITKKENAILKLDSLKTIDLEVKINSHRDLNKNNITQATLIDKNFKENNNTLQSESKVSLSRNAALERPSTNHKSKDNTEKNKIIQDKTIKKLVYHHSTLSMPKLSTSNLNNMMNNNINQVKNSQNLGYKEEIATVIKISPKKIKMELEKHGIKIIETGKNSTRNFKRVNDDLNQKSSNIDKNVVYNSSSGMTNFQSTFNYGTQNMFSRNVKNQLNTISPDLISRQTLDNSSIYKLMNKEKPAEENKKLNDNIKILNSNYYNNIKVLLLLK